MPTKRNQPSATCPKCKAVFAVNAAALLGSIVTKKKCASNKRNALKRWADVRARLNADNAVKPAA